ncbi:type II secretion system F family protein [Halobacillus shinanisalinarum]|uniref:Type II secretion system F family protein n=1 Tax=Halobacillus shinanisalinarum TaxID=2932258 RepID=A0ABY4H0N1_9BACI|nr:competence type IV pilus assembly protein ComGB [Halobacillus shinanisalinarum]UOQ93723.1 type II secretion system F family protein [Halobacillus shinanisalinarum]
MLLATFKTFHLHHRQQVLPLAKQILFLRRLCHLLDKGFPLLESLKMTSWDPILALIASTITEQLKVGQPMDAAFQQANFSKSVISFLYFSRIHQDLPSMFRQCAELLHIQNEYTKKLKQVMRYPIFLLLFVFIAFGVIKRTILPSFQSLFENDSSKPLSLLILKGVDYGITGFGYVSLILIILLFAFRLYLPKLSIEQTLSIYERTPVIKGYQTFTISFLFATHLSSLLRAGLSLKQALEMMAEQTKYNVLTHYAKTILEKLNEGALLGQSLHSCTLLRGELTAIFHHTNDLDTLSLELHVLSELLIDQLKEKLTRAIQLIQPIFFIGIAGVVVLIYASIMLPMYQWMDQI